MEHERQRETLSQLIQRSNKSWHGVKLDQPNWNENSHALAFTAEMRAQNMLVHLILNAYWEITGFRAAAHACGQADQLAAMDRHVVAIAERHYRLERSAAVRGRFLSCRIAIGGGVVHSH